ncbi:class I SAM-dependent methyltransferase [Rubrivivax sp. RP6-9]|uniref:class I SAM-dependent methyltransferase n=1 Tax=Rubrivivax sp. RP6-9 TaxID=3415750 RepID=UPI003CC52416
MTQPTRAPEAGFSADWLRRREPFDARARDSAAPRLALASRLAALRPPAGTPWRVMDLACGTGANLRWLAPRLGGAQQWLVVDHDAALLRRWPRQLAAAQGRAPQRVAAGQPLRFAAPGFDAQVLRRRLDLAQQLEALPWQAAHLVTASALLDLVSADWLQRLAAAATARRVALLLALSVDGRHQWTPRDPDDGAVGARFAAHQRRDKGFGPALGADAVPALQRLLQAAGYRVHLARSDWWLDSRIDGAALALQRALVDGIAHAACEQDPPAAAALQGWRARRQALAPRSTLRVGHLDLLALPPR